jgi:hypothetical protein
MSLHDAAQHLAAQGRGPDDQLIHMSSNEIAGLQAIAKAHGGSLTINPETGLAEAGFLDSLMPMIVGAGLMYATGGAAGAVTPGLMGMSMPATIGLGVGALQTARTGDLGKGVMAGLGAYGGAGMLGAAGQAGMLESAESAAQRAAQTTAPQIPTASPAITGTTSGSPGMDAFIGNNGMTNALPLICQTTLIWAAALTLQQVPQPAPFIQRPLHLASWLCKTKSLPLLPPRQLLWA